MVILHVIRYRQPAASLPMLPPVVDQPRLEAGPVDSALPAESMAVEAKATGISVPWSALRKELWDGVPNRGLGTSFALLDITIRPDLDKSARDGTLEIRSTDAIRHSFMITAYLSGQELTFVDRPGEKALIPVGDILPGGLIRARLMVASLWPGSFEPEFSWFLHDSTGIERAAGKLSYVEYIQQRIREREAK